jgi:gamma-glutamyltranspeptidase/glutathione hydrolase
MVAVQVLQAGGNAMDAAIATTAVLAVVEPGSTGIGGDCFALYAPNGDASKIVAFNGSGRAPAAANAQWYRDQGFDKIEQKSVHSVTIPGAIDAWARMLADHGTWTFAQALAPAIRYAREGFVVTARVARDWKRMAPILAAQPASAEIYLKSNGEAPEEGQVWKLPKLADTLQKIADGGPEAFYTGEIAQGMVDHLNSLGGLHTMEDFAECKGNYVTPVKGQYRGHDIYEIPPNSLGPLALTMFNVLDGFSMDGVDPMSPERYHLQIEIQRLVTRERDLVYGDPDAMEVPLDDLTSAAHADHLRSAIDMTRAMTDLPPPDLPIHRDTVCFSIVDKDRNAISFINSIFQVFGSGITTPESGVLLQNRGKSFNLTDGHPNCIGPRKLPLHTLIPAIMAKGDKVVLPFGVSGGNYQTMGQLHVVSNIVDFGMDLQEAVDYPRVFTAPFDPTGNAFKLEDRIAPETVQTLIDMGHSVEGDAGPMGSTQGVWIDWDEGVLTGAADPRKDGCALGY